MASWRMVTTACMCRIESKSTPHRPSSGYCPVGAGELWAAAADNVASASRKKASSRLCRQHVVQALCLAANSRGQSTPCIPHLEARSLPPLSRGLFLLLAVLVLVLVLVRRLRRNVDDGLWSL